MDSDDTIDCDSMLRHLPGNNPQATRKDSRCAVAPAFMRGDSPRRSAWHVSCSLVVIREVSSCGSRYW